MTGLKVHLHILCFTEEIATKRVKGVHRFLNQVTSQTPHIAEEETCTNEGVELIDWHGDVDTALRTNQERLKEGAECLYPSHD